LELIGLSADYRTHGFQPVVVQLAASSSSKLLRFVQFLTFLRDWQWLRLVAEGVWTCSRLSPSPPIRRRINPCARAQGASLVRWMKSRQSVGPSLDLSMDSRWDHPRPLDRRHAPLLCWITFYIMSCVYN